MSCTRPPKGWYCLRGAHEGPCAAWPTRWTRVKLWLTHPRRAGIPILHVPPAPPAPHPNCRSAHGIR